VKLLTELTTLPASEAIAAICVADGLDGSAFTALSSVSTDDFTALVSVGKSLLAALASVVDRTGWCPVDAVTFESSKQKNIHVIGDSAFAGTMPKSAFSGLLEGRLCAAAIARLFAGAAPEAAPMSSNCYSVVAPGYAISITGEFRPVNGEYTEVDNSIHSSPLDAPPTLRAEDAKNADAWFRTATSEIFG